MGPRTRWSPARCSSAVTEADARAPIVEACSGRLKGEFGSKKLRDGWN